MPGKWNRINRQGNSNLTISIRPEPCKQCAPLKASNVEPSNLELAISRRVYLPEISDHNVRWAGMAVDYLRGNYDLNILAIPVSRRLFGQQLHILRIG